MHVLDLLMVGRVVGGGGVGGVLFGVMVYMCLVIVQQCHELRGSGSVVLPHC